MQLGEHHTRSHTPTAASLKRRDRSPSPSANKIYQERTAASTPSFPFDAANAGGDQGPASERSSPGLDWLRKTQELHLETPPIGPQESHAAQSGGGTTVDEDVGMDTEASHPVPHEAAEASMHDYPDPRDAGSMPPASTLYQPTPIAPHHAPPLHRHLAGSPTTERQSSAHASYGVTTDQTGTALAAATAQSQLGAASFGLAGPVDWTPPVPSQSMHEDAAMMMDDAQQLSPRKSGGWKVTMGYRADCLKCLQRVPGHYSHVVPS
ncbi:hypothetical protein JCM8202v2_001326 [Rhodotorula sphaerocarpa]